MPKFSVDVKAFMTVEVTAPDAATARLEADALVEGCDPTPQFISGWNDAIQAVRPGVKIADANGFTVDGTSDVDRICQECGEVTDDINQAIHPWCEEEDEEPPLDTPSIDTSFHDHEMNVD